jgi:hypothetical protein
LHCTPSLFFLNVPGIGTVLYDEKLYEEKNIWLKNPRVR